MSAKTSELLRAFLENAPTKPRTVKRTYATAQVEIMDYLGKEGWKVKTGLKVPHATSPSGDFRVWFKAQAVYFTQGNKHDFGDARTISYDQDIRKQDGPSFLAWVKKMFPGDKHAGPMTHVVPESTGPDLDKLLEGVDGWLRQREEG